MPWSFIYIYIYIYIYKANSKTQNKNRLLISYWLSARSNSGLRVLHTQPSETPETYITSISTSRLRAPAHETRHTHDDILYETYIAGFAVYTGRAHLRSREIYFVPVKELLSRNAILFMLLKYIRRIKCHVSYSTNGRRSVFFFIEYIMTFTWTCKLIISLQIRHW
jgi:hypothetical protein